MYTHNERTTHTHALTTQLYIVHAHLQYRIKTTTKGLSESTLTTCRMCRTYTYALLLLLRVEYYVFLKQHCQSHHYIIAKYNGITYTI